MQEINSERDERIQNEVLVDCYDDDEVTTAWEEYLYDTISFPFTAKTSLRTKQNKEILVKIEALHFDKEDGFRVEVATNDIELLFSVGLLALTDVEADFDTRQVIEDWKYWKNR